MCAAKVLREIASFRSLLSDTAMAVGNEHQPASVSMQGHSLSDNEAICPDLR
jgi:hypothetical protein